MPLLNHAANDRVDVQRKAEEALENAHRNFRIVRWMDCYFEIINDIRKTNGSSRA